MGIGSDIYKILTLRCDESARLLSAETDIKLHTGERIALRMHLLGCKACRRYKRQLSFIRVFIRNLSEKILSDSSTLPPLDQGAKEQMKEALRNESKED